MARGTLSWAPMVMRTGRWTLAAFTVALSLVVSMPVSAQDRLSPSAQARLMDPGQRVWLLWSQHMDSTNTLWWRAEAGPFTDDECRAELKRATTRPKVAPTKHYDITPQHLEKLWGHAATPDKGTWISCWAAPFDFNRDLTDR